MVCGTKNFKTCTKNLKDENNNVISEFKDLPTDNEDIKDIIVTVVNYFKQDIHKPLHYNDHEVIAINSYNKAMEENIKVNETNESIINVFKLMFLFYEKIYNENIVVKDTSDIYACYIIEDNKVV